MLETPFEKELFDGGIPFSEYPRPQLKRESYICLNGKWSFTVLGKNEFEGEITVPFAPESRLSGVERYTEKDDILVYSRRFSLPDGFNRGRVLLNFGAVDQYADVFINGSLAGSHEGGYLPFSFDITDLIKKGENEITVNVSDPLDRALPYGKQTERSKGMWYTKISGIWQTVWLESVPDRYIEGIKITPCENGVTVKVKGGCEIKAITVKAGKRVIFQSFKGSSVFVRIDEPRYWSPDDPYLYDITLTSGSDSVCSYFALRTVEIKKVNGTPYICLNGKPIFLNGLLDQGYFSDGIFLPATPAGFENDVITMKKCGFNMLRKHIKLEPELFYYYCDKHGMIVFQDMINNGKYSFFFDTALATLFLKSGFEHRASKRQKKAFLDNSKGIIEQLYNHPCVCCYTVFNEGWGQFDADGCYDYLKLLDGTRIFDATSGWFAKKKSDVESHHVYFKKLDLKPKGVRPLVLSEFGGYSYKIKEHSFNLKNTYGYRFFTEKADFEKALFALYENEVADMIRRGLSAAVYTQVSDVEDETNGLFTYDRQLLKVDAKRMKEVNDKLYRLFEKVSGKES
ncbi:MAG: glycoside hydrolase family 2 [Clostridia bacterium]|nr:glycoside hydrolase family 2 [Clostridia bacterium]